MELPLLPQHLPVKQNGWFCAQPNICGCKAWQSQCSLPRLFEKKSSKSDHLFQVNRFKLYFLGFSPVISEIGPTHCLMHILGSDLSGFLYIWLIFFLERFVICMCCHLWWFHNSISFLSDLATFLSVQHLFLANGRFPMPQQHAVSKRGQKQSTIPKSSKSVTSPLSCFYLVEKRVLNTFLWSTSLHHSTRSFRVGCPLARVQKKTLKLASNLAQPQLFASGTADVSPPGFLGPSAEPQFTSDVPAQGFVHTAWKFK